MEETLEQWVGGHPKNVYVIQKGIFCDYRIKHGSTNRDSNYNPIIARAEVVLREDPAREILRQLVNTGGTLLIDDVQFGNETNSEPNRFYETLWALSAVGMIVCNGYSWRLTAWGFKRAARDLDIKN